MSVSRVLGLAVLTAFVVSATVQAEDALTAEQKTKVEAAQKEFAKWGTDASIVALVKELNTTPPAEGKGMTQEKWKELSVMSPEVRAFTKNKLAELIKAKKGEMVSEAFVNLADGSKGAFLSKTSSWIHKGKPKHDVPMSGKMWMGSVEVDESTGIKQIQVSVPVLSEGKAIGSIVIGLNLAKL